MQDKNRIFFHPIISCIQKMALYETKSKYYLVGSNNTQTRFRVIKIDRMEPVELVLYDDKVEYSADEIRDLVQMIDHGNRQRSINSGFSKVISAFGIVGFVRFLEGYYIILITKRRKVAVVGQHTIYKIEDTNMIYIPHETIRIIHPDETRYVKMFQNIDLASNFYFSYSYDITHTLQHNLTPPKHFIPNTQDEGKYSFPENVNLLQTSIVTNDNGNESNYGVRSHPNKKFVWNMHLINENIRAELHPDWILYIVHGFIGQSNINVYGRALYITLIARRSSKYAGTRFLKRGANFNGDVANEVETEQILHDSGVSSLNKSHFTSFVQMRGSIPGHWKQEMGKMVGKPAIAIDFYDPYAETAGAHFNDLLKRYGAPVYILNLVKQRERKKQEMLISEELNNAVKYLNQFLPSRHQIIYKAFDMARKNKGTNKVMELLADIAKSAVNKVGFFHNQATYYSQKLSTRVGQYKNEFCSLQTGIVRTNCVDCLDRTNTAQFAIGKCVLGYQLCALGILDSPILEFDTDCVRILECLYEDHGDTLALQYGGSQLVHRIKTYRKTAPWTSQGNDIMQTLSRYISNTFSDAEKQNTINLFLGVFQPDETKPHLWEYPSDYYFHHKPLNYSGKSLTRWWDTDVTKCLPYSYYDLSKACSEIIQIHAKDVEMIDSYLDYYKPFEMCLLSDVYATKISNSIRDFMPHFTTNYSPFTLRIRPVKHRDENTSKGVSIKNPSVSGQSSTSSTASSTSSDDEDSDCENKITNQSNQNSRETTPEPFTFKAIFPTMKEVYGTELRNPEKEDVVSYKKYVLIGKKANGTAKNNFTPIAAILAESIFNSDTSQEVTPVKVNRKAINAYEKYISLGKTGGLTPNSNDIEIYKKYASLR